MTEDGVEIGEGFRLHTPVTVQRVGARVAFMRDVRGISARDMAVLLRVTDTRYARFERGEESMSVEQLIRLAAALDAPVSELVR